MLARARGAGVILVDGTLARISVAAILRFGFFCRSRNRSAPTTRKNSREARGNRDPPPDHDAVAC